MNSLKKLAYEYLVPFVGRFTICKEKCINVIYYHDVLPDSMGNSYAKIGKTKFENHMKIIKKLGYNTKTFTDINNPNYQLNKKDILICFDDGWKSNYDIFTFMKENGLKYNIFLTAGKIGVDSDFLTWEQVEEMKSSGIVDFGAHTFDHINCAEVKIDIDKQILNVNELIKEHTGTIVKDFCFPYGAYNKESLNIFSNYYNNIYTSDLSYSYKYNNSTIFGRSAISNDESDRIFKAKLNGYYLAFSFFKK